MSNNNRVVWSEGLFLQPQHFQQQERYFEHHTASRLGALLPYGYGYLDLQVDQELLKLGRVGLARARGIAPDGTPFDIPEEAPTPEPLQVPEDAKNAVACLCMPLRRPGMPEIAFADSRESKLARFLAADHEARDAVHESDASAVMKVGRLRAEIRLEKDLTPAYAALPLVRIVERRADGQVVLDDKLIHPCLDCRVNARLYDYVKEIYGLLRHRAQALAERVGQPGAKGVAEFADFLLLQLCNREAPVFAHLAARSLLHPELLFRHALALAGELSTFGRQERRSPEFPVYRHDALETCLPPLVEEIRRALTAVLEQNAISIPLADRGRGVYLGEVRDVGLIRGATFVLAVGADVPSESLRGAFPSQIKIGPVEKIRDLVMSHLPGIVIRPLPVAPRQIPYHAGNTYFELDRRSEFWKGIETSRMIAIHIAGDFPGLAMEMWAIRD